MFRIKIETYIVSIFLKLIHWLPRREKVMPLKWKKNHFAIDFETVAAGDYWGVRDFSDIWQIGITRMSDGKTKTWTVRPIDKHMEHPYWEWYEYKEWGRLTKQEVESAPSLIDVYRDILKFIGLHGVLIAHNAFGFDKLAWEETLKAHNLPKTSHVWMDTKHEYKKVFPGDIGHRLMHMVNRYTGTEYIEEEMHDAGEDAKALFRVLLCVNLDEQFNLKNWERRA